MAVIIWFAMVVPFATAFVLYRWYHHRTLWWEFLIPIVVSVLLITVSKLLAEKYQTWDHEYWGGWVTQAEYFEDWNQRVPCSHPKYVTRTDSKGRTHQEFAGYQHVYDVDYHPEYWEVNDSNGATISVSRDKFEELCDHFGNRKFVELHRSYHTNDGDKYVTSWDESDELLEPVTTIHSYENRVQASHSLFNFPEVDPEEYGLFEYPKVEDFYHCPSILGESGPSGAGAERVLALANAKLGAWKQVRLWVVIFQDQPLAAGLAQQNYWKGGNKNEFVVCIGVNEQHQVQWCYPFSWTEVESLKVDTRNFVIEQQGQTLDLERIVTWLAPEIEKRFVRKQFADFDYLQVEPPVWAVILTFILTIGANVGLSAWIIHNEHKDEKS